MWTAIHWCRKFQILWMQRLSGYWQQLLGIVGTSRGEGGGILKEKKIWLCLYWSVAQSPMFFFRHYSTDDNSIWKPVRNKRRPQTPNPPIRPNTTPLGPWAKSDKVKADLFANYLSEVFTPYDQALDQDIEQELAKPIQPPEHLPAFFFTKIKTRNQNAKPTQGSRYGPHHSTNA